MTLTDTVAAAVRNAWSLTFGDGIEAPEPAPSTVVWDEPHRVLRRYDHDGPATGPATLLVPPLAAPATCYDLRPDQSLARFLCDTGRSPYLVDYGDITYADRRMGFEDFVDDIVPEAIRRVSADRGGAAVDLVGWSLGGVISLLTAAADPTLPIRSIIAVGPPLDYDHIYFMNELRLATKLTGGLGTSTFIRAAGGVPSTLTRVAYRVMSWDREVRRPWFVASNLADTATLARMETVDRFQNQLPGYPGRFYNQLFRRFMIANDIGRGVIELGDRKIALADISVPVLLVGGHNDVISPAAAVEGGLRTLTGSVDLRYVRVPGSHLGILAGPGARDTTWQHVDTFLSDVSHLS
ncbi:alpha/beta fold hydrolase [Nocardia stercoris]|uniref:Alpha/beta hydrolase n=1 Tax=Nocardia stercoris TaxID=2483361 RepID=A0A3M2LDP2_9NOCA|nr:alpha/beta fold hydrolase [Nocardia stercoris]RMI35146.1 alpha/beta hydrolase [Nocardia stercoris]